MIRRNFWTALFALVLMLVPVSQASAQNENVPGLQGGQTIDQLIDFVIDQENIKWAADFAAVGLTYTEPSYTKVVTNTAVPSACTDANGIAVWAANPAEANNFPTITNQVNPAFYCVSGGWHGQNFDDNTHISTPNIYLSESWLLGYLSQVNPDNYDFAVAYLVAHEFGHHIEHLLGAILDDGTFCCGRNSEQIELPADCLAGVWASWAFAQGFLTDTDVAEAMDAAFLLGSDLPYTIGDPNDHGTREERSAAFGIGFLSGKGDTCMNTNLGW